MSSLYLDLELDNSSLNLDLELYSSAPKPQTVIKAATKEATQATAWLRKEGSPF